MIMFLRKLLSVLCKGVKLLRMSFKKVISSKRKEWIFSGIGIFLITSAIPFIYTSLHNKLRDFQSDTSYTQTEKSLKKYFNTNDLSIHSFKWLDLDMDGKENEFYVLYSSEGEKYFDIFTKNNELENLFHQKIIQYYPDIDYFTVKNEKFLIKHIIEGSDSYLDFGVYKYDGIGKAYEIFSPKESLFQAEIFIKNHERVYLQGQSKKYELIYNGLNFKLEPYKIDFNNNIDSYGDGNNIIAIRTKKNITYEDVDQEVYNIWEKKINPQDLLIFTLNGEKIDFIFNNEDKKFFGKINLRKGDALVIDENLFDSDIGLRWGSYTKDENSNFYDFKNGFYPTLLFKAKGEAFLQFQIGYESYYYTILISVDNND